MRAKERQDAQVSVVLEEHADALAMVDSTDSLL